MMHEKSERREGKLQTRIKEKDYQNMLEAWDMVRLTDDEAGRIISELFGFSQFRISIVRELPAWEKEDGWIARNPLFVSNNRFYICFECCGRTYEAINGDLHMI